MLLMTVFASLMLQASSQGLETTAPEVKVAVAKRSQPQQEFILTSSPSNYVIKHITKDFSLRCERAAGGASKFDEVFDMRIEKQFPDGRWVRIADISGSTKIVTITLNDIMAHGNITNDLSVSYLEISWALGNDDAIGAFRCTVLGMSTDQNALTERTQELDIQERALGTAEVIEMLMDYKQKSNDRMDSMETEIAYLADKVDTNWPRGDYVLLQPNTGCPNDLAFENGANGIYNIHTESSNGIFPQTTMSDGIHLPQPVIERVGAANILHLKFCNASVQASPYHWPSGSYCINRYLPGDCPVGFVMGQSYLRVDEENINYKGSKQAPFLGSAEQLHFCCMNSGSATENIYLPTDSPFYLYRLGSTCQKVAGMQVIGEYISIDTEDLNNNDGIVGTVPDNTLGAQGDLRMELCYYFK